MGVHTHTPLTSGHRLHVRAPPELLPLWPTADFLSGDASMAGDSRTLSTHALFKSGTVFMNALLGFELNDNAHTAVPTNIKGCINSALREFCSIDWEQKFSLAKAESFMQALSNGTAALEDAPTLMRVAISLANLTTPSRPMSRVLSDLPESGFILMDDRSPYFSTPKHLEGAPVCALCACAPAFSTSNSQLSMHCVFTIAR